MTRNLAVHEYEYDEHHNIIRAVSAENSKYTFDYDDYGNALESRVVNHGNDQEYIRTKAEYTDNGNHIRKVTDAMNRLKTVSQAVILNGATQNAQVGYTYTNDRLTQIAHNGFNYEMPMMPLVSVQQQKWQEQPWQPMLMQETTDF